MLAEGAGAAALSQQVHHRPRRPMLGARVQQLQLAHLRPVSRTDTAWTSAVQCTLGMWADTCLSLQVLDRNNVADQYADVLEDYDDDELAAMGLGNFRQEMRQEL